MFIPNGKQYCTVPGPELPALGRGVLANYRTCCCFDSDCLTAETRECIWELVDLLRHKRCTPDAITHGVIENCTFHNEKMDSS